MFLNERVPHLSSPELLPAGEEFLFPKKTMNVHLIPGKSKITNSKITQHIRYGG